MNGLGCYYKRSLDKWSYGKFLEPSVKVLKSGKGYPVHIMRKEFNHVVV